MPRGAFRFGGGVDKKTDPRLLGPTKAALAENCDFDSGALRPVLAPSYAPILQVSYPGKGLFRYQDETAWRTSLAPRTYSRFGASKCWSDDTGENLIQVETDGVLRDAGRPPTDDAVYSEFSVSESSAHVVFPKVPSFLDLSPQFNLPGVTYYCAIMEYEFVIKRGSVGENNLLWLKPGEAISLCMPGEFTQGGGTQMAITEVVSVSSTEFIVDDEPIYVYSATVRACLVSRPPREGLSETGDGVLQSGMEVRRPGTVDEYYVIHTADNPSAPDVTIKTVMSVIGQVVDIDDEKRCVIVDFGDERYNINKYHVFMFCISAADFAALGYGELLSGDYGQQFAWFAESAQDSALVPIGSGTYNYAVTFVDSDGVETAPAQPGKDTRKTVDYLPEVQAPISVEVDTTPGPVLGGAFPNERRLYLGGVPMDEFTTPQARMLRIEGLDGITVPAWVKTVNLYRTIANQTDLYLLRAIDVEDGIPDSIYDTTPDWVLAGLPLCPTVGLFPPIYLDVTADTYERKGGHGLVYHEGRFYCFHGNRVYFSDGSIHYWGLDDYFQLPSDPKLIRSAGSYLVIITAEEVYRILGQGPENYSVARVGTIGCETAQTCSMWNKLPVWSSAAGLCAYGGEEARVFTLDVLKKGDFDFAAAVCSYVLDDVFHLVGAGDPAGQTRVLRWDLRAQKLMPDLLLDGRVLVVHVDESEHVPFAIVGKTVNHNGSLVTGFWVVSLAGNEDDLIYTYLTGRVDDGAKVLKRYNLLYPFYSGGLVGLTIQVLLDGRERATIVAQRDRHYLPDGLVGFDLQLRLTGDAVVDCVEYDFTVVSHE